MKNVGTLHIAVGMVPINTKSTQTRVVGKITDKMHTTSYFRNRASMKNLGVHVVTSQSNGTWSGGEDGCVIRGCWGQGAWLEYY